MLTAWADAFQLTEHLSVVPISVSRIEFQMFLYDHTASKGRIFSLLNSSQNPSGGAIIAKNNNISVKK